MIDWLLVWCDMRFAEQLRSNAKAVRKALRTTGGDRALAYNTLALTKVAKVVEEAVSDTTSDPEWDGCAEELPKTQYSSDTSGGTPPDLVSADMADSSDVSEVADSLQQRVGGSAPARFHWTPPGRRTQYLGHTVDADLNTPVREKGQEAPPNPRLLDTPRPPQWQTRRQMKKLGAKPATFIMEDWDSPETYNTTSGADTMTPGGGVAHYTPGVQSAAPMLGDYGRPATLLSTQSHSLVQSGRDPFASGVTMNNTGGSAEPSVKEWCETALVSTLKQFLCAGKHAFLTDPMSKKGKSQHPFAEGGLVASQLQAILQEVETRRLWAFGTGKLAASSTKIPLSVHLILVEFSLKLVTAVSQSSADTEAKMMPLVTKLTMLSRQLNDAAKHTTVIEKTWQQSTEDITQFSELTTSMALEAHKRAHDWKKLHQTEDTDIKALASALSRSLHSAVSGPNHQSQQRQQPGNGKRRREDGDGDGGRPHTGTGARQAGSEFEPAPKSLRTSRKLFEARGLTEDTIPSDPATREQWFKIVPCRAHLDPAKGCYRGDARCVYSHRWTLNALEQAGATRADLALTRQG